MKIFNHFSIQLTSDQKSALSQIEDFMENNQQIFLLKGYAGTGKTTLLKGIISYIHSGRTDFHLLAPTGRAALVIKQKTGATASTIHKGIYNMDKLEEKEEGNSFKFFYKVNENRASARCVYLIDEASMISDIYSEDEFFMFGSGHLLQDLFKYVFEGDVNRKIIFIGDDAQLPPVNMNLSPALTEDYLREKYSVSIQSTQLTEVIRQESESGILENATNIRESISKGTYNNFNILDDKLDTSKLEVENVLDIYKSIAQGRGVENAMIITHSNRQALYYNNDIRKLRYGDKSHKVQPKDWLLITKNNYNGDIELFNGMFVQVIEIGKISHTPTVVFKVKGGKTVSRQLSFRKVLVELVDTEGSKQQIRTTLLDDFLQDEKGRLHPYDQRALYIDFKNRMSKKGIKPKSKEFTEALRKDLYFNALQAKYGYAITCHKSQGGEWANVIVDFNVYMSLQSLAFYRWAYTAITRSQEKLYCINPPAHNALSRFVVKETSKLNGVQQNTFYVPQTNEDAFYFVKYRKQKLLDKCKEQEISINLKEKKYQVLSTFKRGDFIMATVRLWYGDNGFTKNEWLVKPDNENKKLIESILIESLLPDKVPFIPKFDFQKELHEHFFTLLKEEEIPLTNIDQKEWSDVYYIHTGTACASIEFSYNKKEFYTNAMPKSTLGKDDEKLNRIIQRLLGHA